RQRFQVAIASTRSTSPVSKKMSLIATVVVMSVILGMFRLNRDPQAKTSKALWIPTVYLLIISSRPVTAWFGVSQKTPVDGIYSDPTGQLIDLTLLVLALAVLAQRGKKVSSLLRSNGPILLFFSYAALSCLWSDFPFVTFKHWFKGIEDVLMVLVVVTDGDPLEAVKRLLTRAGFILIPLSLLFSMYYPSLGRVFTKSWEVEYVGVTDQKNQLGMICMIFGLGSVWRLLKAYRDRQSRARNPQLFIHSAMLALVIWLLQMSHSLTSSVCLILTGTVMALVSGHPSGVKSVKVHLLSAAAVCSALIPIFVAPGLVESFGRDTTFSGRTEIWKAVIGLVHNPLLGVGYESFLMGSRLVELRKRFQTSFQEAHNGYLEVYLNLGWIGVSLFALILFNGYQKIVGTVRRQPAIGSLSLGLLLTVAIQGLTEAPFRMMTTTIFFLLW